MTLRDCSLLLPNYELEGYPRTLPSGPAGELLSGWVALWHPLLLSACPAPPRWQAANQLPADVQESLFILPSIVFPLWEPEAEERITTAGSVLLRPRAPWLDFQAEVLAAVESAGWLAPQQAGSPGQALTDELRSDFAALGYAYLQIQLMTRQLRYTSNLDQLQFGQQLSEAATATVAGNREVAVRMLGACFDSLGQERDHYYSLDLHLIDVTLLAETTLGKSLSEQLQVTTTARPTTFLASGRLLQKLQALHPDTAERLKQAFQTRQACLAGGLDVERAHPLMTRETMARDFMRGRRAYQASGFEPPRVFARSSYGLAPESVAMLRRWGFEGCFLNAWSGGAYPEGSQAKISWEAPDGTFLSALSTSILDASDPASFLSLGWSIGEALDHQHVPTIVFAHWPNRECEFRPLLDIVAKRTPALGRWRLADDYFQETDQPYHQERLTASGFKYNWLVEAPSPAALLHATQQFHRLQARCRGLQNLCNLAWQLDQFRSGRAPSGQSPINTNAFNEQHDDAATTVVEEEPVVVRALELQQWSAELAELVELADSLLDDPQEISARVIQAHALADRMADQVLRRMQNLLYSSKPPGAEGSVHARLMMNPRSYPMRLPTLTTAKQSLDNSEPWHFAAGRVGESLATCVDVPSHGFIVSNLQSDVSIPRPKQRPLAEVGGWLNNEFLEVQVDGTRGHLRSLHIPAKRGNRLSLMIARRDWKQANSRSSDGQPSSPYAYSEMIASDVRILTSSNIRGLVRATGRLKMDHRTVAKFEIDYDLWRGSRILEVSVRLHELEALADCNPWRSAYIIRLAWPTDAALLRSFAAGYRQPWPSGRALAPNLIEIDETDYRTHYLTGGLAFHRRTEERFLETILAVSGDQEVKHRVGIAVDLPHPLLAASAFLDHSYEVDFATAAHSQSASGWLASVDMKNVIVDFEAPLVDDADQLVGIRLFLTETEGRSTNAHIRLIREIESAARVDYLGGKIGKLTTEGDRLTIALRSSEQVNVDVLWKR